MSILAEPRRKQRISVDPQNVSWKNDEQKFGKKVMEKMGWQSGEGLGRNLQGHKDNLKLKANHTGKGLGADKMASYDSTWIAHHDDFADLLSALNKKKEANGPQETAEKNADQLSLELRSKSMKRRIHYQKFTRAKDIFNFSEKDKSAVLGVGVKRSGVVEAVTDCETKSEVIGVPTNTTVSTLSVGDYFAAKMAALKAKREQVVKQEPEEDTEPKVIETVNTEEGQEEALAKAERKRLRKERRRLRALEQEAQSTTEMAAANEDEEPKKEHKKKRKHEEVDEDVEVDADGCVREEEEPERKKRKKQKKAQEYC